MNWADLVIVGILLLSGIVSLLRGFVSELMSLIVWVCAFLLAGRASGIVAENLLMGIDIPQARVAIAYSGVFVLTLIVGGMFTWLLRYVMRKTGLSGTDRILGLGFGLARGVLLICAMVVLSGFTALPKTQWWQDSLTLPPFVATAERLKPYLPESVRALLQFAETTPPPQPATGSS